MPVHKWYRNIH